MAENSMKPRIRFKGYTDAWEQRKFGDCVLIQRGGSPRPIENYITIDKNGINWIKIGDVSVDSRYILKTEEKIKPEGEKYSRKVYIGDLILSNSMSFGRPYILGVNGCIHDGWLLIRDINKKFDIEYLLQLLSSNYMYDQYKSLASGGVVNNLNSDLVQSTNVVIPSIYEQAEIGCIFKQLDNLITLHQRKYDKIVNIKKALLEKMFPENSEMTPKIRFKGFTDAWEQRKLYRIAEKVIEKNENTRITETFTNSAEFGIISQRDYFYHDISNLDNLSGYYVVQNDDFVYNPRISVTAPVGPINRNKLGRKGVMSPLYTVFRASNIDFNFLEWYFKSEHWHGFMKFNGDSGARSDRFSIKDEIMFQMPLPYPTICEQEIVGEFLSKIDNLITLHQRQLEKLKNIKTALLEKMFI